MFSLFDTASMCKYEFKYFQLIHSSVLQSAFVAASDPNWGACSTPPDLPAGSMEGWEARKEREGMNGKKEEWGGIREKEEKEREFKGETTTTTTILRPLDFVWDYPGEPVPER